MNESGALLNLAASDLVQASRGSPNELAVSSQKYSKSFEDLMHPGMQLAGQTTVRIQVPELTITEFRQNKINRIL